MGVNPPAQNDRNPKGKVDDDYARADVQILNANFNRDGNPDGAEAWNLAESFIATPISQLTGKDEAAANGDWSLTANINATAAGFFYASMEYAWQLVAELSDSTPGDLAEAEISFSAAIVERDASGAQVNVWEWTPAEVNSTLSLCCDGTLATNGGGNVGGFFLLNGTGPALQTFNTGVESYEVTFEATEAVNQRIPAPATLALFGLGLAALGMRRRAA